MASESKCDSCEYVGFLFSPFDDKKYGCFCSACIEGMEGDISEREEFDSYADDY